MKLTIEPTNELVLFEHVAGRVWSGVTEKGVTCKVIVLGVRVDPDQDESEFAESLLPMPGPVMAEPDPSRN